MKRVSICYSSVKNMGDELNKDLVERCFNVDVIRKSSMFAQISGIGSGLSAFCYGNSKRKNFVKKLVSLIFNTTYVWGTGFISYEDGKKAFFKKNMNFCCVRGTLTKEKVEKLIGKKLDIPVGDGGILASYLLDKKIEKRFDVGIIPHFREKYEPKFKELQKQFKNSIIIDIQQSPEEVVKKIAQCKIILSSSLHGLIIADSLRIPNMHIVLTDKLLGDGFKFDDYYSAYNIPHKYIDLKIENIESLKKIVDEYQISDQMVEKMKNDMLKTFPFQRNKLDKN